MVAKCYDELPTVKLVDGPSPLEGLVVSEPDRYVCFDGFTNKAAEVICGELGFPGVKKFSAQELLRTSPRKRTQRITCDGVPNRYQRLLDCSFTSTECSSSGAVRLKCKEPYSDIVSTARYSKALTCPSQAEHESDQQAYHPDNISFGFCNHPGNISNGQWDSNMTSFGSNITLTCDEGYIINGSATLQCVGLPGRSIYFPIWSASIPVCWKDENETNDGIIITTTAWNRESISSDKLSTFELTTLLETTATSPLRGRQPTQELTTMKESILTSSGDRGRKVTILTLVPLLCVVLIVLAILSTAWCKHHKKRNMRRTSRSSNQPNDRQLQMHPVDMSNQNFISTDHVVSNTTSPNAGAEDTSFPNHPGNIFRDVTAHQENLYHIYQDSADVDKKPPQPSNFETTSLSVVPLQNNLTGLVLSSESTPYINRNRGLQETSLDQSASGYEDCTYQDVDLCGKDRLKKNGSRSLDGAHLFDERCYNSLNFSKRQSIGINSSSEYDHCNRAFPDERVHSAHTDRSAPDPASQNEVYSHITNDNVSCSSVCSTPTVNREDVFYYQLHPDEPSCSGINNIPKFTDAFDSGEYSMLNPEKGLSECYDLENPTTYASNTRSCEELYATVNKTVEAYSAAKPATCEELYARVDKKGGGHNNKATPKEELYATVDKTGGGHNDKKITSQEELYVNVTNTEMDF